MLVMVSLLLASCSAARKSARKEARGELKENARNEEIQSRYETILGIPVESHHMPLLVYIDDWWVYLIVTDHVQNLAPTAPGSL